MNPRKVLKNLNNGAGKSIMRPASTRQTRHGKLVIQFYPTHFKINAEELTK